MKWIGRVSLAVLSLFVLARAASAQQGYPQQAYAAPQGYVKVDNPQDYLPGYPEGGIPVTMGADGRYYAQEGGYAQQGYAQQGYAQGGGYTQGGYVQTSGCCAGGGYPVPQPQPVPLPPVYGGGYPAGGIVVVEETCCRGGGLPASAPGGYGGGYGYGQPIAQYVERVPCCAQSSGYSAGGYYGTGYHPAPSPCCVPPSPPPPQTCDWRRPHHPQDPYSCPPGWGEVRLNDSFFWGGGGVGPEYIPGGGGGGGGGYAYAGAGAVAYASASSSVRVNIGGGGGYRPPHKPPHKKPPHKKGGGGKCCK